MTAPIVVATGSYSSSPRGRGPGIELLSLDPGTLAVEQLAVHPVEDASFLLWSADGGLLYAVQETAPTRVLALRVQDDGATLEEVAALDLTGSGGCHIAPGAVPGTLVVCDYGSGHVEVVGLDAEGLPERVLDVCDHTAYRPGIEPHPHQAQVLPGTELLAVTDLGLDRVYVYAQAADGSIDLASEITLARGQGPRHLAADHESRALYLACELSGELAVAERTAVVPATGAAAAPAWSVLSSQPASGLAGTDHPSHVELAAHEALVLVANRGPDTLSALSLGPSRPVLVDEIAVGAHPRHFALVGDLVLVAAQESDRIDVVRREGQSLTTAREPVPSPSVCCIAPRP